MKRLDDEQIPRGLGARGRLGESELEALRLAAIEYGRARGRVEPGVMTRLRLRLLRLAGIYQEAVDGTKES